MFDDYITITKLSTGNYAAYVYLGKVHLHFCKSFWGKFFSYLTVPSLVRVGHFCRLYDESFSEYDNARANANFAIHNYLNEQGF